MALTPSTMELEIGAAAPEFALPDTEGSTWRREDFAGKPLLIAFICNHCPYVVHLKKALADFGEAYQDRGLAMVAVSANDVAAYPADAPDKMAADAERYGYTFPYLYDENQQVARAYHAACTPDFFLFDAAHKLHYRGQFDGSRPNNGAAVTGADLRAAADSALSGGPAPTDQVPSVGCNIKWKSGNEPG
jgi:peroxiredoxin